jgi:hypothetical protein
VSAVGSPIKQRPLLALLVPVDKLATRQVHLVVNPVKLEPWLSLPPLALCVMRALIPMALDNSLVYCVLLVRLTMSAELVACCSVSLVMLASLALPMVPAYAQLVEQADSATPPTRLFVQTVLLANSPHSLVLQVVKSVQWVRSPLLRGSVLVLTAPLEDTPQEQGKLCVLNALWVVMAALTTQPTTTQHVQCAVLERLVRLPVLLVCLVLLVPATLNPVVCLAQAVWLASMLIEKAFKTV